MDMFYTSCSSGNSIMTKQIISMTNTKVVYKSQWGEVREVKTVTTSYGYHKTWEEARQWVLDRARKNLEQAQRRVELVEAMKP